MARAYRPVGDDGWVDPDALPSSEWALTDGGRRAALEGARDDALRRHDATLAVLYDDVRSARAALAVEQLREPRPSPRVRQRREQLLRCLNDYCRALRERSIPIPHRLREEAHTLLGDDED